MFVQIATVSSTFYQIGGFLTLAGCLLAGIPVLGIIAYRPIYGMLAAFGFIVLFICAIASGDYEFALLVGIIGGIMIVLLIQEIVRISKEYDEKNQPDKL